jgi:hypothetical protein
MSFPAAEALISKWIATTGYGGDPAKLAQLSLKRPDQFQWSRLPRAAQQQFPALRDGGLREGRYYSARP